MGTVRETGSGYDWQNSLYPIMINQPTPNKYTQKNNSKHMKKQRPSSPIQICIIRPSSITFNLLHHEVVLHHLELHSAPTAGNQLPSDLGADHGVALDLDQIQQDISLVLGDVVSVALGKAQETLVPVQRQIVGDRLEAHEVEDKTVNNLEWQRILLVDEHLDEDRSGSGVVHFAEVEKGRGRVEDGDGDAGKDGANDLGLLEGAGAAGGEGEEETLEEGGGLVERLLEAVVEMDVELLVLVNVLADAVDKDQLEKPARISLSFPIADGRAHFCVCADFCAAKSLVAS